MRVLGQICCLLFQQHFDLFQEWSRIWGSCEVGVTKTLECEIIRQVRKMYIPSTQGGISWIYNFERRIVDGSEEGSSYNEFGSTKDGTRRAIFS